MKNVQEGVHIYAGSILRGDGHHRIARRVVKHVKGKRTRPWNVLLGWVGVDGALLAPPSLSASETLACIVLGLFLTGVEQCFVIIYHTLHHFQIYFRQAHGRGIDDLLGSLEPLMISLRENRLRHGMSVAEAMPIAHCTVSWTEVSVPSTRHVTTAIGQSAIDLSGVPPRVSLVAVNTWRLVGSICELRTATANTKIAMKHSTTGCSQMWESRCMGKANGAMQYLPRGEIKRSLGHGLQEILVTSASHFAGACQCLPTTGKI